MKLFSFSSFGFTFILSFILGGVSFSASAAEEATTARMTMDGTRILKFEEVLRPVYANATKIEEVKVDPMKSGGFTLMGLIGRLMGGTPNSQFEGMDVSRYIYAAYRGDSLIGVTHGSTFDVGGQPIDVIVHYDPEANVRGVEVKNAPASVMAQLDRGYLKQFEGYSTEDFQNTYKRKHRHTVTLVGRAMHELKSPSNGEAKTYFDRIVRSLRFNVAFVDIAYFISRLPMMDFNSRRISSIARSAGVGSPEAKVEGTQLSPSVNGGKTVLIQNAPPVTR